LTNETFQLLKVQTFIYCCSVLSIETWLFYKIYRLIYGTRHSWFISDTILADRTAQYDRLLAS